MLEALAIGLYCFLIVGTAALFLKVVTWRRERLDQRVYETLRREHPERVYGTPEYDARFSQPDFAALETHLGRPLPEKLKKLYSDSQTMRAVDFQVVPPDAQSPEDYLFVNCFFPADRHAITDLWPTDFLSPMQLPFATDGSEGVYYLELLPGTDDPAVCLYYYDGDFHVEVASALSDFLSWQRVFAPRAT